MILGEIPIIDIIFPARFEDVDFTHPLYGLETNFFSSHPRPIPRYQNLLKPFTILVWILIMATIVLVTFLFRILIGSLAPVRPPKSTLDTVYGHSWLFSWAAMMRQDNVEQISRHLVPFRSARTLVVFWFAFCFIISNAYICNLRAFLVAIDYEKAVDNAQDVLDQNRRFFVPSGTGIEYEVFHSKASVYLKLAARVQEQQTFFRFVRGWLPPDTEDEVTSAGAVGAFPKLAIMTRFSEAKKKTGRMPVRISKEHAFYFHIGYLLPKFALWKNRLNLQLMTFTERGIYDKLTLDYMPEINDKEVTDDDDKERAFTLEHLMGAYLVLGIGYFISIFSIFIENLSSRKQ